MNAKTHSRPTSINLWSKVGIQFSAAKNVLFWLQTVVCVQFTLSLSSNIEEHTKIRVLKMSKSSGLNGWQMFI